MELKWTLALAFACHFVVKAYSIKFREGYSFKPVKAIALNMSTQLSDIREAQQDPDVTDGPFRLGSFYSLRDLQNDRMLYAF